ncbi:nucleoside triphosphate pyrophosphohydrolase [Priestia megaterium]|nr:nucleoside triphosphate pyrophosphohydrolase [Priestia megaterium]
MSNKLTIIGLGAGDLDQLPLGVYRLLQQSEHVWLRTKEHPVIELLEEEGMNYTSFDQVYESNESFEDVYKKISNELIDKAQTGDVIYAVPGHPLVAERTVQLLLEKKTENMIIEIKGGQSFLDPIFTALKIDPIEGFQLLDGTALQRDDIQLNQHVLIGQVYDQFVASDVKLTLMEHLPAEYEIYIVTAAGSADEHIRLVKLYELDHDMSLTNLTTVYVPPVKEESLLYHQFTALRQIIAALRGPNGCPWDQKQTHKSLKPYLLEEAYELLDAIDREDDDNMIEELGDVLLQVMLHAQIGEDEGMFTIDDVILHITDKMIRRHPHVFGETVVNNADDVVSNWDQIKKQEKGHQVSSLLDSIPKAMPSLMRAYGYQKEAAKVGFDWEDVVPMWEKVTEEVDEFKKEIHASNLEKMNDEFGDILFALVNVSRFYKIDPETALAKTNEKFATRFRYIEKKINELNKQFSDFTLEELDQFWNEAKQTGL